MYLSAINNMPSDPCAEALNRLYNAVFLLASETGSIEQRLARAYFLYLRAIQVTALPDGARERFERIRLDLQAMYPTNGILGAVDRDRAVNLAQSLLLLYDDLNP